MRPLAILALAAAVLVAPPAPAHTATSVGVYDNYFTPTTAKAEPGHEVTWTWTCAYSSCPGTHNVTAYEGATFASGNLSYPASYTATMPSVTTVRYRCTIHSTLSGGRCTGMCAILSQDASRPQVTWGAPANNEVVTGPGTSVPVTFTGGATDDQQVKSVTIRLYDLLGRAKDHLPACAGCGTASASWSQTLMLSPGPYVGEAIVKDWVDNTTTTPQVRFFVL